MIKLLTWPKMMLAAGAVGGGVAISADTLPGPVPAEVLRVIDGDSVEVEARIWLGQTVRTTVRVRGLDTPELRGRCAAEAALAQRAKTFVEQRVGTRVALYEIGLDKFGGRVVARLKTDRGEDLAVLLIGAGLARPYDGRAKAGWCGV